MRTVHAKFDSKFGLYCCNLTSNTYFTHLFVMCDVSYYSRPFTKTLRAILKFKFNSILNTKKKFQKKNLSIMPVLQ